MLRRKHVNLLKKHVWWLIYKQEVKDFPKRQHFATICGNLQRTKPVIIFFKNNWKNEILIECFESWRKSVWFSVIFVLKRWKLWSFVWICIRLFTLSVILQKSSVGSVGVFLWIWSKKVFKKTKNCVFFCFGDKLRQNPLTTAVSCLDLTEKWH